jgi:hypothetical protein
MKATDKERERRSYQVVIEPTVVAGIVGANPTTLVIEETPTALKWKKRGLTK